MNDSPATHPSLLLRLRDRGDDRAWTEFVEIYTPLIEGLARRKGLQAADVADLVQEVFGAVSRAIDRYDPDPSKGSFRGWLSRIARNLILDAMAARRRHPPGAGDTEVHRMLDARPAPSPEETALFEIEYRRRAFAWAAERVRDEVSDAGLAGLLAGRHRGQERQGGRRGPGYDDRDGLSLQESGHGPAAPQGARDRGRAGLRTGREPMNRPCREAEPSRLRLLLDDELPGPEKRRLESHLEACAACRDALEEMAGEPGWWDDVRKFVPRELAPPPLGPTEDASVRTTRTPRRGDPTPPRPGGDIWLDFLAPSDDPEALGRLGHYKVLGVLGRGGMGIVLKAFDPTLDRMVALKVLSPALAASGAARHRFAREARAAAAVVHEHVVAIHAVSSWRGLPYLVMQYIPGRSLQDRIDGDGPLEVEEILRIGMQAAAGLAAAHAHGLVHRDVKPSNILLEDGLERVKITDFGLARAADDASLTQSGVLAGTPQYMAPEQAQGEGIDHRADLFSLGSVLYAMCAGRPPFRAETTVAVIRRVCDERPRPLREINPDVPAWLAAIVEKLHAKDPSKRFASATELADALATRLAQLRRPDEGPLPPIPQPAARWGSSSWWAVAAGILVVVAGVGGAEAGGFTSLRALVGTIFRVRTAEGTLVIDVSDPEVKVRVDGNEVVDQRHRAPGIPLSSRPAPGRRDAGRPARAREGRHDRAGRQGDRLDQPGSRSTPGPGGGMRVVGLLGLWADRAGVARPADGPPSSDPRLLQERIRRLEDQLARMQAAPAAIVALPPPSASDAAEPIPSAPSATAPAVPVPPRGASRPRGPGPGRSGSIAPRDPDGPALAGAAPAPAPVPAPPAGLPTPGSPAAEPRPAEVPSAPPVRPEPEEDPFRPPTPAAAGRGRSVPTALQDRPASDPGRSRGSVAHAGRSVGL